MAFFAQFFGCTFGLFCGLVVFLFLLSFDVYIVVEIRGICYKGKMVFVFFSLIFLLPILVLIFWVFQRKSGELRCDVTRRNAVNISVNTERRKLFNYLCYCYASSDTCPFLLLLSYYYYYSCYYHFCILNFYSLFDRWEGKLINGKNERKRTVTDMCWW